MYKVYIVRCSDRTLYTGIAKNVQKRIQEHNQNASKGSKYAYSRRPVTLVYEQSCKTRSDALKREGEIKKLKRKEKINLIKIGG